MFFADAQTTFYIVGTVFMIFMLLVLLIGLISILVITSRIRKAKKRLKNKLDYFKKFSRRGRGFADGFFKGMAGRY